VLGSTVSLGTSSSTVAWTENNGGSTITSRTLREFYGGVVNASNCSGVTWTQAFALSLTSPVTVTGMNPGYCYYWTVTLTNGVGSGSATSGYLLITPAASFTSPANGSTIITSNTTNTISWGENSTGSSITSRTLTEYYGPVVTPGTCNGVTWTQAFALSLTSPVTATGMNPGDCYYWTVRLTNGNGLTSTATSGKMLIQ
jgi:hypothetical protein